MSPADLVMQSYGRCCASSGFFDSFYQYFLASSPEIREKFANTNMPANPASAPTSTVTIKALSK